MAITYTSEFRAIITQAVALGASVRSVSKLHGVPESTVRGWIKANRAETPIASPEGPASEPDTSEPTETPGECESSPEVITEPIACDHENVDALGCEDCGSTAPDVFPIHETINPVSGVITVELRGFVFSGDYRGYSVTLSPERRIIGVSYRSENPLDTDAFDHPFSRDLGNLKSDILAFLERHGVQFSVPYTSNQAESPVTESPEDSEDSEDSDDDTTECHHCGEQYDPDSMTEHDGNEYCEECFSEQFSCCDRCHDMVPNDETRSTPGNDCYCEECHREHVTTCDDCGSEAWSDSTLRTSSGNEICRECYEDSYFTCDGCDEIFHCDHSCPTDDSTYCEDCYPGEDESGPIREYSTRVNECGLKFFGKPKDKIFFGVELEVCASSVNSRVDSAEDVLERVGDDFIILKEDGSLPDEGFEIVTTPATLTHHAERFRRLMKDRPVVGLKSWDARDCGMHVHVSRGPLSQLTIGKMLVFVNDANNADFVTAIAGRDANGYCKRYDKKITDVKRCYPERYEAINLQNRQTIEFRIFKGTLKYESFMKNIEFVASVVAFCKIAGIRDVDRNHYLDFLESRKASYPHLYAFLASKGFVPPSKRVPMTVGAER